MQIQRRQVGNKGMFFIEEDGKPLAEMTYTTSGDDLMIIDHTEVDDALRGKNVGYQLVKAGVEYAREKHLKIIPRCPFAKAIIEKKIAEFGDVLKK